MRMTTKFNFFEQIELFEILNCKTFKKVDLNSKP